MAYSCDNCGKGIQTGRNIRHHRGVAGGRWKRKAPKTARLWYVNLHSVWVVVGGKIVRRQLCTKCLRRAERPLRKKQQSAESTEKMLPQVLSVS
ncbi:MAG: hypothetical protein A2785_01890 [Candidatus Chisholmbacteria bacterium RIFCSPHIGHO2_01_FULL_49_18]|uniref:50S ribosomal protein L28 n=1 Tax=Candidatus Chisholmbacteria bacterium RIFCSPHIGHO2_01_FULL_49_18 TaxID=1797590 RepID=A0A1G1VMQ3_9BACT|nr:MAG: hypothetical protein A2785_01890 [Candidatus Chisholmbacteria bacterium RIFCSPHIGHO2_01_FULL_49_18]